MEVLHENITWSSWLKTRGQDLCGEDMGKGEWFCEGGNEFSVFIRCEELPDQLSNSKLFKDFAPHI